MVLTLGTPPTRHGDVDWAKALCKKKIYDADLWFDDETAEMAALICMTGGDYGTPCPIREFCLQYALNSKQDNGVWGGMTPTQRRVAGWTKHRVKCPHCRSKRVESLKSGVETCMACGLSWKI